MSGDSPNSRSTGYLATKDRGQSGSEEIGASGQFQLDVYGELMDAIDRARSESIPIDDIVWGIQLALMDFVSKHWRDPDSGIWEVRGPPRSFTHSKVMAWVASTAPEGRRATWSGRTD